MARVLLTGMSGAGKTAVLEELRRRGDLTVDTDHDGWVLPERVCSRKGNPYGRTSAEIALYRDTVELEVVDVLPVGGS